MRLFAILILCRNFHYWPINLAWQDFVLGWLRLAILRLFDTHTRDSRQTEGWTGRSANDNDKKGFGVSDLSRCLLENQLYFDSIVDLPISQCFPVKIGLHWHEYARTWSMQMPPFSQGCETQSSISNWQNGKVVFVFSSLIYTQNTAPFCWAMFLLCLQWVPLNPSWHSHSYSLIISMHVPLFLHGLLAHSSTSCKEKTKVKKKCVTDQPTGCD